MINLVKKQAVATRCLQATTQKLLEGHCMGHRAEYVEGAMQMAYGLSRACLHNRCTSELLNG